MADIQISWNPAISKGDWTVTVPSVTQSSVTVQAPQPFGTGDGVSTQFALASSQGAVSNVVAQIYRSDWQGNQLLYATPRTNNVLQSQNFASVWGRSGGGTGSAPVVTANYAAAPDGTTTASRIIYARGAGVTSSDFSRINQSQTTITGQTYAQGLWLCSTDGASTYQLQLSFSGINPIIVTVTPTWTYFEHVATATDTARGFRLDTIANTGSANADVLAWGAMQVKGSTTGSYIPTTTAPVTVTDYALTSSGLVTLASAPVQGAVLTWTGSYQISTVTQGGYLQMGGDLDNAVLISLCTDRIADPTDAIPDSSNDPRGWWGDAYGDPRYPVGSRMWLLRRAKQTQETLQRAYDYHVEALQWLIDDGVVAGFDINVEWVANGQLGATVVGYKRDGTAVIQNTYTWVWSGLA